MSDLDLSSAVDRTTEAPRSCSNQPTSMANPCRSPDCPLRKKFGRKLVGSARRRAQAILSMRERLAGRCYRSPVFCLYLTGADTGGGRMAAGGDGPRRLDFGDE